MVFAKIVEGRKRQKKCLKQVMRIANTYRNRALAYWIQSKGLDILLNVRWGDERSYGFVFEGIEKGGTVGVSTNGCIRDKSDRYYFKKGLARMVEVVRPECIVNYSCTPEDIFGEYRDAGIDVVQIENYLQLVKGKVVD